MKCALINAHTSYAPGAKGNVSGTILTEHKLSTQINKELKKILELSGIISFIVDTSDITPYNSSLHYKVSRVNTENADLAVETHFNSVNIPLAYYANGFEVLYSSNLDGSKDLAAALVTTLKTHLPFKIRRGDGLYERNSLYLLKNLECPTALIEVCFLTHHKDRLFLIHSRALEVIAYAIADGIVEFGRKKGLLNV